MILGPVLFEHGTPAGYNRERKAGGPTCRECRDAMNAYQRSRYVRGVWGVKAAVAECGTEAGYKRHLRLGEDPCLRCREEWREADRLRRRRRRMKAAQKAILEAKPL